MFSYQTMFLVVLKKKFIMEYCCRLKSQYFGAPNSGALKMRGLPAIAGIAGGVPTPLVYLLYLSQRRSQGVSPGGPCSPNRNVVSDF